MALRVALECPLQLRCAVDGETYDVVKKIIGILGVMEHLLGVNATLKRTRPKCSNT